MPLTIIEITLTIDTIIYIALATLGAFATLVGIIRSLDMKRIDKIDESIINQNQEIQDIKDDVSDIRETVAGIGGHKR